MSRECGETMLVVHFPHFHSLPTFLLSPNHSHPHKVSGMKEKRKWDETIGVRGRGERMG